VRTLARSLLILLFVATTLAAETSLDNARRAQALLGADVWSRVITIRNKERAGVYPGTVHAVVFELVGILWFYTDLNGTQSFSLERGQLEREKADFGPLLQAIEPGFASWTVVTQPTVGAPDGAPLLNGCFIESVVALRERQRLGLAVGKPRLLSYYLATGSGQKGHTVLAYEISGVIEIFDPGRRGQRLAFPKTVGTDPLDLARALEGRQVGKARYLPLGPLAFRPA
jgi:hypothetical protein